jgi:hypothetical protein
VILFLTLLQLIWFSLSSAFLIFWLAYFVYLKFSSVVRKLNKRRQNKLRNTAKYWLYRAAWLMLTNALLTGAWVFLG